MGEEIFPFALGIVLLLGQPVIDLAWRQNYEKTYSERDLGGAEWIAGVSAFLPSAALTTYGALLIAADSRHPDATWILGCALTIFLISVLLYIRETHVGVPARDPVLWHYSHLQIWLIVLNVVGIGLAIYYNNVGS